MRHDKRLLVCALLLGALLCGPASAGLQDYVAAPDAAYQWSKVSDDYWGSMRVVQLDMTSQVWQGIPWRHNVWVCIPSYVQYPHAALLIITGGSGSGEMDLASFLTDAIGAPVVILGGIPNQPLFDDLREDALIAYTFQQFLQTGDETWPLLFPMTKSAVRAMDAVQEFGASDLRRTIDTFVVTGASKRGWTTWLTGVVDPGRVKGIAPLVIDTLNMPAQLPHQLETWGKYSEQIEDYTRTGLVDDLSGEGAPLVQMVDPYSYRDQITMPKLIVNGTNDRYWVIDALNLYYDGLVGEKYILYVPNSGHDLEDIYRVLSTMSGFFHYIAGGAPFPRMTWKHGGGAKSFTLTINSTPAPYSARIWSARSRDLDFRDDQWSSTEMTRKSNGSFAGAIAVPRGQNTALFGEADFYMGWYPFTLSTQVRVIPYKTVTPTLPIAPRASPIVSSRLRAGAAKVAITPWSGQYLAGYDSNRVMRGVHDDLWARALYLDDGDKQLVLVSLDSIGMTKPDLDDIADSLWYVSGGNIIITSTHTHSGPDVIGLWGPDDLTPGWNDSYIEWVKTCVIDAVYQAWDNSRPARVLYGSVMTTPADRIAWNVNERTPDPSDPLGRARGPQDYEITVLQVMERSPIRSRAARTIATAFNFACHPEVAGDSDDPMVKYYASSDIAHYAYGEIESATGGMAMWLQGALGAMVTADKDAKSWAECERIGRTLGRRVMQGVGSAHADASPRIAFARRTLNVPLFNDRFHQALVWGVLHRGWEHMGVNAAGPYGLGIMTEVRAAQIGNLQIATTPGEAYPKIGLNIKHTMLTAPYKMVVGLGQDEVGYIMYSSDYGNPEYAYETSMSVGPTIGEDVERAVSDAIGDLAP